MNDFYSHIKQSYDSCFLSHFRDAILKEEELMMKLLDTMESFSKLSDSQRTYSHIHKYKEEIHQLIWDRRPEPKPRSFEEDHPELLDALQQIFTSLPEQIIEDQTEDRFKALDDDSLYLRLAKTLKRTSFYLLRPFKKNKGFWKHKIPLRNLAQYHFQGVMLRKLSVLSDLYFSTLSGSYVQIKDLEEREQTPTVKEISKIRKEVQNSLKHLVSHLTETVNKLLEETEEEYQHAYLRVGTIELSAGKFSDVRTRVFCRLSSKKWSDHTLCWENTLYALFEEWKSDVSLMDLQSKTKAYLEDFQRAQIKKLGEQIDPLFKEVLNFIEEGKNELTATNKKNLSSVLKKVMVQADRKLQKELIPKISEKLTSRQITNLLNKLQNEIHQEVEKLTDEHVIVKNAAYDHPIASQDLQRISPYELISFEMLTSFDEEVDSIKSELFQSMEGMITNVTDLDNIIEFSIKSALALGANEERGEDPLQTALSGLDRAKERLEDIQQKLATILDNTSRQVEEIINKFCTEITALTENENVRELRLRISKAKAEKQAQEIKQDVQEKILRWWKSTLEFFKKSNQTFREFVNKVSSRFILTAQKPTISREVSDFLVTSQHAISKLPLIYRRLYQIEPLDDLELFEGRKKEYEQLVQAFENWEGGKFASTVIIGEKWSGLTTFINYSIYQSKYPYPIIRFAPGENIDSTDQLIHLLCEAFGLEQIHSLDELVRELNEGPKRVVILEDLQNYYLRKIDGFATLQVLFQLVNRTHTNVFWVTTCTLYAWQYLSKTIRMHEYFSYIIELENLTNDEIINIIWKRNRISGYNIRFELTGSLATDKKFAKLSDADQQEALKKKYFEGLNNFARSNVSLALIFWLLSTMRIDESTITMGSFEKPDLNFVNTLSEDKIHLLHALILHDGLTEFQLAEVLNTVESESKLTLLALLEDGIVVKKGTIHLVNPIVYRNIILMLKAKNLIH